MKYPAIYYSDYLELSKILSSQSPKSKTHGKEAHDETLFIIIHQTYELWFKQILHELNSIHKIMSSPRIRPSLLSTITHRLERITGIQKILNDQLKIIETMTPLDFMDFRDYLVPASGFQSTQFRSIETVLGLKSQYRLEADRQFFTMRLSLEDQKQINELEKQTSILELLNQWLERMPFTDDTNFNFWTEYKSCVEKMLDEEAEIIEKTNTGSSKQKELELANLKGTKETFGILFDDKKYQKLFDSGKFRLSRKAKLAAIFTQLYRDEPILQLPHKVLELLLEIDEQFTLWRYKHSLMAHRLLGAKVGTGGSSGHEYLKNAADNNRIFIDLFDIPTFLLPKSKVPALPTDLKKSLGFVFEES